MPPKKNTDKKKDAESSDNESKTRTSTKEQTKESVSKDTKKDKKETKTEKSEDALSVERGDIEKVLDALTNQLLNELLLGHNIKKAKNTPKKSNIKEVLDLAAKKGQAILFANLEKEALKGALETLSKDELDHDNKTKMLTEVKKNFTDKGHKNFFKALNKETLVKFAAALEFEEEEATKEELENALEEEILIAGLREVFGKMAKEFVVDAAKELRLAHSGSKKAVETRILAIAYPHLAEEEEDEKKKKGDKKGDKKVATDPSKISKDDTFEDLYQYYTKDLHEWCEKNGLKKTGTKKDLIHRMLKYFKDPEDASVKPQQKGEKTQKKRKKSEAQKKKEAKEKREAKKKEAEASGAKDTKDSKDSKDTKDTKKKDEKKGGEKEKAATTGKKK